MTVRPSTPPCNTPARALRPRTSNMPLPSCVSDAPLEYSFSQKCLRNMAALLDQPQWLKDVHSSWMGGGAVVSPGQGVGGAARSSTHFLTLPREDCAWARRRGVVTTQAAGKGG